MLAVLCSNKLTWVDNRDVMQNSLMLFTPDPMNVYMDGWGGTVAHTSLGRTVSVLCPKSGTVTRSLDSGGAHQIFMTTKVDVAVDGGTIATANSEGLVKLWKTGADESVAQVRLTQGLGWNWMCSVSCMKFNRDASLLAACDFAGNIYIIKVETAKKLLKLRRLPATSATLIHDLAWFPRGDTFVVTLLDGGCFMYQIRHNRKLECATVYDDTERESKAQIVATLHGDSMGVLFGNESGVVSSYTMQWDENHAMLLRKHNWSSKRTGCFLILALSVSCDDRTVAACDGRSCWLLNTADGSTLRTICDSVRATDVHFTHTPGNGPHNGIGWQPVALALAMGTHARLGHASELISLGVDVLEKIIRHCPPRCCLCGTWKGCARA